LAALFILKPMRTAQIRKAMAGTRAPDERASPMTA